MNEPPALPNSPQTAFPARRKRLGCFPIGCIVLVIVLLLGGVVIGSFGWLFYQGGQVFVSDHSALTQPETTEEQYQKVLGKFGPFSQAMNEGRAASVEITPEDVNVLVARGPQFQSMRGKFFLAAKDNHLTADLSLPLGSGGARPMYFNGRIHFDASYASNGFALFLRRLEPLGAPQGKTRFSGFLNHPTMLQAFSQEFSRGINEGLRQQAAQDPGTADLLRKLRTVIVQDGKIVITAGAPGRAEPEPVETPTPVATPAN